MPKLPRLSDLSFPRFGELLRHYRQARGLSVEELAEATHTAPSAIRAYEDGSRPAPPKDTLRQLIHALHLTGDDRDALDLAATMQSPFLGAILRPKDAGQPKLPPLTASILVFMIADVRGYTRFTQAQGDSAAARLATKFAEVARGVLDRWDGRLVEIRGDEILAIFGSVRQALHAALDMQERFSEATMEDPDLPLAVGIGLDVGEAVALEEGFRGAALNRAARLCSLAGGGEILVSTGVAYIAPIVEGVAFSNHSQAQLKGFDGPTQILGVARAVLESNLLPPAGEIVE
jgi:class 3 adenylate cyclase